MPTELQSGTTKQRAVSRVLSAQRRGDVGGGPENRFVPRTQAGDDQRSRRLLQRRGRGSRQGREIVVQIRHPGSAGVDVRGDGESEACDVLRGDPADARRDLIESRFRRSGDKEGPAVVTDDEANDGVVPLGDLQIPGPVFFGVEHRLSDGQIEEGCGVGHILAEDQDGVGALDIAKRGSPGRSVAEDLSPRWKPVAPRSLSTPTKKFSGPTSVRSAWLASSEAVGEPIPIARLLPLSNAATCSVA